MQRMIKSIALSAILVIGMAAGAWASELDDAQSQGLVGERPDGYIGAVVKGRADIDALVRDINAKRRAKYEAIAAKRGTSLADVERYVGQKLITRAAPGEYVMTPGGQWVRK